MTTTNNCWACTQPDGTCAYPKTNDLQACPVCGNSRKEETKTMTDLETKLAAWTEAKQRADEARALEMNLRKECLALAFPEGKIGTNTLELGAGWKLKGTYKINYSFDEQALDAVLEELRSKNVPADTLVRVKREPSMREINKLSQPVRMVLNQAMIAKPGTPELKLEAPKK